MPMLQAAIGIDGDQYVLSNTRSCSGPPSKNINNKKKVPDTGDRHWFLHIIVEDVTLLSCESVENLD